MPQPATFLSNLEATARAAGMTHPLVVSTPEWALYDAEQDPPKFVHQFTSAVDIANYITDIAQLYVELETLSAMAGDDHEAA